MYVAHDGRAVSPSDRAKHRPIDQSRPANDQIVTRRTFRNFMGRLVIRTVDDRYLFADRPPISELFSFTTTTRALASLIISVIIPVLYFVHDFLLSYQ